MQETELKEFIDNCYAELQEKQSNLLTKYNLSGYSEYLYDPARDVVTFYSDDLPTIAFHTVFAGSYLTDDGVWLWAWANEMLPETVREASGSLVELGVLTGIPVFSQESFEANQAMTVELSAMVVRATGGIGLYRVPNKNVLNFLVLVDEAEVLEQ